MADIEFIAQMIQLKYAATLPSLMRRCTADVLESTPDDVLSDGRISELKDTYQFFRRIELMMRLVLEDRNTILPEGEKCDLLARTLGMPDGESLRVQVGNATRNVRKQFLQTAKLLSST